MNINERQLQKYVSFGKSIYIVQLIFSIEKFELEIVNQSKRYDSSKHTSQSDIIYFCEKNKFWLNLLSILKIKKATFKLN